MDKRKLISNLGDRTADPFEKDLAMHLIKSIDDNKPMGKLIIRLLELAENGNFK